MEGIEELRVYQDREEMLNDIWSFIDQPDTVIFFSTNEVKQGNRRITYRHFDGDISKLQMSIMGLEFTRAWVDIRAYESIRYVMSRMRHPKFAVDSHAKVFYGTIRE